MPGRRATLDAHRLHQFDSEHIGSRGCIYLHHPTKRLMRLIGIATMTIAAAVLASCSASEGDDIYPTGAKELINRTVPNDGQIHAVAHGSFNVQASTFFCTFMPGVGLDGQTLRSALVRLGQSDYYNGAARTNGTFGERTSPGCTKPDAKSSVFVRGEATSIQPDGSYRVVLVAWQENALWVGIVNHRAEPRADATGGAAPINDGPAVIPRSRTELNIRARERESLRLDEVDLSKVALNYITRTGK